MPANSYFQGEMEGHTGGSEKASRFQRTRCRMFERILSRNSPHAETHQPSQGIPSHPLPSLLSLSPHIGYFCDTYFYKILNFVGACVVAPNYCIVSEFCTNGSLEGLLRGPKAVPNLSWVWLVKVAADAAAGILHLHCEGIIHRVKT